MSFKSKACDAKHATYGRCIYNWGRGILKHPDTHQSLSGDEWKVTFRCDPPAPKKPRRNYRADVLRLSAEVDKLRAELELRATLVDSLHADMAEEKRKADEAIVRLAELNAENASLAYKLKEEADLLKKEIEKQREEFSKLAAELSSERAANLRFRADNEELKAKVARYKEDRASYFNVALIARSELRTLKLTAAAFLRAHDRDYFSNEARVLWTLLLPKEGDTE